MNQNSSELTMWLLNNASPIIRYRTVKELMDDNNKDTDELLREVLNLDETKNWLKNLGSDLIHGATDTHAENALAKCLEYGLSADIPEFDEKARKYCNIGPAGKFHNNFLNIILLPFLIRAGYSQEKDVKKEFLNRLTYLHRTAKIGRYDFYRSPKETKNFPKPWCSKRFYKKEFNPTGDILPIPSCYDFYAICCYPSILEKTKEMINDVIEFVNQTEFQTTPVGYIWNEKKKYGYAAGGSFLAKVASNHRLIMFLELAAPFNSAQNAEWFRNGIQRLEKYRTPIGTYRFPKDFLLEKHNGYYIYGGYHMGLGENRRSRRALEIESTFRMLRIKKRMKL